MTESPKGNQLLRQLTASTPEIVDNPKCAGEETTLRKLQIELFCLVAFIGIATFICIKFDALEVFLGWANRHELYEIEDVFSVLILSSVSLMLFTFRRHRILTRQLAKLDSAEHRIQEISMHDSVTQLPNRVVGLERLNKELSRAVREGSMVAVILLDIDRFKQFNEVFGQAVGDEVLRKTAERLLLTIRDMDTLVRMGGDEFLIIQPGIDDQKAALAAATRVMQAMDEPLHIAGQAISMSMSAGVAVSADNQRDPDALIRNVMLALHRAKEQSLPQFVIFERDMDTAERQRQELENDLRRAIDTESLNLHYQPLFTVNNRKLLGFEALLRWQHPGRGNVSPAEFIPIAEQTGMIVELGEWVLERACQDAAKWSGNPKIAVNLSPVQFSDPDLAPKVAAILQRTGLDPERLELEITEGVLIKDVDTALGMLLELKALGVRISMDDFGTGYSSLSYLKRFPFDKIKIDRSFVGQLEVGSEDAVIVRAILAMGHSLGMIATAEGVESVEQLDYLLAEGCEEAQGFLLGKPMPFEDAFDLCSDAIVGSVTGSPQGFAGNDPYFGDSDDPRKVI